jgi:hypothetical protein
VTWTVLLTCEAVTNLQLLEGFLVDIAMEQGEFDLPGRSGDATRNEMRVLETNPCTCRKLSSNRLERELIIPYGRAGHVALFEIVSEVEVVVSALRHQREGDCY